MRPPKIYQWHIKHNGGVPGLVRDLKKDNKRLEKYETCPCGCDVGFREKGKYYCMSCKKELTT